MNAYVLFALLGIAQGLTEFLPVSSSAHQVILQKLLGVSIDQLTLSVTLHLGTTLALIIFFFKDIIALLRNLRLLAFVLVVTVITGIFGVSGKEFFESFFKSQQWVALFLCVTGVILILTKVVKKPARASLNIKDAFATGITQAIALLPGISRSGITISTLLFRKIDRQTSFRFSFIASIPAVLGATALEAKEITSLGTTEPLNLAVAFLFSFFTGLLSLKILRLVLRGAKLHYFGYYCIFVAAVILLSSWAHWF